MMPSILASSLPAALLDGLFEHPEAIPIFLMVLRWPEVSGVHDSF
jgi:hypothetical protein